MIAASLMINSAFTFMASTELINQYNIGFIDLFGLICRSVIVLICVIAASVIEYCVIDNVRINLTNSKEIN